MTRQLPEGNSLRDLQDTADILRHGFDVWPADADERRIDDFLRRTRARPQARESWPWWAWFIFGAAAMLACCGVALLVMDALATGAAAAVQAQFASEF
jgi:hypothetical protein